MVEVTVTKAAKLLGVTRQSIQSRIKHNSIPHRYRKVWRPFVLFTEEQLKELQK